MDSFAKYLEIMLNSNFPQSYLLDTKEFLRFLKDMGFKTTLRDLEYYDEKGILKPAARLTLKQVRTELPKIRNYFFRHIHYEGCLLQRGKVGNSKK